MSLDFTKVVAQMGSMIASLRSGSEKRHRHLQRALDVIADETIDLAALRRKIASSKGKTTWLVADLVEGITLHYGAPSVPTGFTVLATDGSQIDVDRHRSTRCYLINIGAVALHYGVHPIATLDNFPRLYVEDDELVITQAEGQGREQPVEGALLGIKRTVEECRYLVKLASEFEDSPTLALLDGTLILWGLEAYPEFVTRALLEKGFLVCLDELKKLNNGRKFAFASYISFPRSTDVVNLLRLVICPYEPADCDRYCATKERDCDVVAGVRDSELFSNLLQAGERSALFISPSKIIDKYYREHRIFFFYLRVDDEIARVEIPQWVAKDEGLLGVVHALALDQCRRGHGYPVALSEAHERAVVTTADRENFWQLVESSLMDEKMPMVNSAKSRSKKMRWI